MLSKTALKKIKEKLLLQQKELAIQPIKKPDIDTDGDEIDEIQGNMLIELHNQFIIRNGEKLIQIEDALKRVEDRSYGVCQDCEEDIPEKRLLINPYFLTCVACAEDREIDIKQRKKL